MKLAASRGQGAWLILAAALAVPGLVFYGWWSRVNGEGSGQLSAKPRPAGDNPFSNAATPAVAASTAVAVPKAVPGTAAPKAVPGTAAPSGAAADAVVKTFGGALANRALPDPAAGPAAPPPPAAPVPTGVASDIPPVAIAKDPTLSPADIARIEAAKAEAAKPPPVPRGRVKFKPRPVSPEALVELQGIISNASGNRAIVNGEMVRPGDVVRGVKVVKVTAQSVFFSYKNKKFKKSISK